MIEDGGYRFTVKVGKPKDAEAAKNGTKLARGANFRCLMSGTPIAGDYIKAEGKAGRMGARLMAIVAEGERGRVYLAPTPEHEAAARKAKPEWKPDVEFCQHALSFRRRQLRHDDVGRPLHRPPARGADDLLRPGAGSARASRSATPSPPACPTTASPLREAAPARPPTPMRWRCILALRSVKSLTDRFNDLHRGTERPRMQQLADTFARKRFRWSGTSPKAIRSADVGGQLAMRTLSGSRRSLDVLAGELARASLSRLMRRRKTLSYDKVVSTDPPYYDNIGYADLSDFFYVWLRRSLRPVFPDLFATLAVPKAEELVATPYRHGGKEKAEAFFLDGMTQAMHRLAEQAHPAFPVTIYYAFKQSESDERRRHSQHWLGDLPRRGDPRRLRHQRHMADANRAEQSDASASGTNALASSIVLVCRPRAADAPTATRREFVTALKAELPAALAPSPARQHRAGGPGAGGHRPRHGGLHPLRQGARRRGQAALGARGAGAHQPDPRRGAGRAGGRLRRRQPLGAGVVRAVGLRRGRVRRGRTLSHARRTLASTAWSRRAS